MAFFDADSKFVSFSPVPSHGFEEDFGQLSAPWSPLNSRFGPVEDWATTSPALSHQSTPSLDSSHYASSPADSQHERASSFDSAQDAAFGVASSSSAPFPCDPFDFYKNTPIGGAFPNIFGSGKSDTCFPQTSPSFEAPALCDPAAADFELKLFDFSAEAEDVSVPAFPLPLVEPAASSTPAPVSFSPVAASAPIHVEEEDSPSSPALSGHAASVDGDAFAAAPAVSLELDQAPKKKIGRPKGSKNGDRIYRIAAALGRPPREIDERGHYKQPYMDWLISRHREKRRQRREEREAWIKAGRPSMKRLDYPVRQKQAAKRARIGGRFASKKDMAVLGLRPGDKVAAVDALVQVNVLPLATSNGWM